MKKLKPQHGCIVMRFEKSVAKDVGTDAAIILSNIEFWQAKNKANKKNYHDGAYWTYNTLEAWSELFDYLTISKIRTCLKKLKKSGYIIEGTYNKTKYDRTKWYASVRNNNSFCDKEQTHLSELTNRSANIDRPIPYSKPDNKPDNKQKTNKKDFLCAVNEIENASEKEEMVLELLKWWKEYTGLSFSFDYRHKKIITELLGDHGENLIKQVVTFAFKRAKDPNNKFKAYKVSPRTLAIDPDIFNEWHNAAREKHGKLKTKKKIIMSYEDEIRMINKKNYPNNPELW